MHQETCTGPTTVSISSKFPVWMVRTAQWSYLKDWISLGPSLSIHRKGRPWLFCPRSWFFFVVVGCYSCIYVGCGRSVQKIKHIKTIGVFFCAALLLHRYLFWTEWGQNPCIGRSRLDGSDQVTLVNSGIMWPNGISLDYEVERHACTNIPAHFSAAPPHSILPSSWPVIWLLCLRGFFCLRYGFSKLHFFFFFFFCRKTHYTGATPAQIGSRR